MKPGDMDQVPEAGKEHTVVTCVYCGMEYPDGTPTAKARILTEHIKVCDKHPMRAAERRITELEQALIAAKAYVEKAIKESGDNNNYVYTGDKAVLDSVERALGAVPGNDPDLHRLRHKHRHVQLHRNLDELVADYITHTQGLPSKTTVLELMTWSNGQTVNPEEDK